MISKREARWLAEYVAADSLYTTRECGCLVFVVVDMAAEVKAAHATILRESLAGRALKRAKRGELPPLHCAEHSGSTSGVSGREGTAE